MLKLGEAWCPVMKRVFPKKEGIRVTAPDGTSVRVCCEGCGEQVRSGRFLL